MANHILALQAKQVGEKAYQLLTLPGFRGNIVAVFTSAAYLQGENGEIFWMGGEDLPLHQRSLIISYCPELFAAGQIFCSQGSYLEVDDRIYILMDHVSLWQAPALDIKNIPALPELIHTLQSCLSTFPEIAYPWNQICERFCSSEASSSKQEIDSIIEKSGKLIGLGPGFSPAGDDFVGGLLFVYQFFKRAYPDYIRMDEKKILSFIEWSRPCTNLISWTILKDLAFGHGPEPVHKIMNSILQGKDLRTIYPEADELAQIGHTTGQAIFYGMLTGLRLILGGDNQKYRNLKI